MQKPKLSIVIPTKNEEKYLPLLLDSIKNQNFSRLETIVADANSSDKTREIASKYECKIVEGGQLAFGRNQGAKNAASDVVLFIDSDVVLPKNPRFLQDALEEFNYKRLDVAGTLQRPIPTSNFFKNTLFTFFYEIANSWMLLFQYTKKPYMQVCMFSHKKLHEKLNGFDERLKFAEDSEYAKRAVKLGAKFGILRSDKVFLSPRRFEKEGVFLLSLKYAYWNIKRLFGHEFRENSRIKYGYTIY